MQSSLITSTMLHTMQSVSAEKGAPSSCTAASANKDAQNILAKYVKLAVLAESVKAGGLFVVDYNNQDNHVISLVCKLSSQNNHVISLVCNQANHYEAVEGK